MDLFIRGVPYMQGSCFIWGLVARSQKIPLTFPGRPSPVLLFTGKSSSWPGLWCQQLWPLLRGSRKRTPTLPTVSCFLPTRGRSLHTPNNRPLQARRYFSKGSCMEPRRGHGWADQELRPRVPSCCPTLQVSPPWGQRQLEREGLQKVMLPAFSGLSTHCHPMKEKDPLPQSWAPRKVGRWVRGAWRGQNWDKRSTAPRHSLPLCPETQFTLCPLPPPPA